MTNDARVSTPPGEEQLLRAKLKESRQALEREVAERKRLERAVIEVADNERRRLARILHDTLCQSLGGIGLLSSVLLRRLDKAGRGEAEDGAELLRMIKDAAEELHSVVRWLRPSPMDGPDMAAALTDLAPSLFQGIPFEFHCPEPVVLSDHYAAAQLLQIACQAVNDALKHPGIQRITVSLSRQKEGVALAVTDDGSPPEGMPTAETLADEELLRLRAGAIGATLTISSQPKQGNSILCTLPLAN